MGCLRDMKVIATSRNMALPNFRGNYTHGTFIYTNDTHGTLGTLPYLISGVNQKQEELKDKSPITLSAGDEIMYINKLNPELEFKRKQILVKLLNAMHLDVMTLGNHELDNGLQSLADVMKKAKFKILSTNAKISNTPLEQTKEDGTLVKSYIFKNKDGEKYGILGVLPIDEFSSEVSGETGDLIAGVPINYYGSKEEIKANIDERYNKTLNRLHKEVQKFESEGINKIVLLSHLGYEKDRKIVNDDRINGIDVIIGGHSHDKLNGFVYTDNGNNEKPNVFKTPEGKPIIITQAGSNANNFGVLDVLFDKNGVIASDKSGKIKGTNELLNSQDFEISAKLNKLIYSIFEETFKDTPEIGIISESIKPNTSRNRENTLVTATLNGFVELAGKSGTDDIKDLDFAMIHASCARGNLPKGDLNEGQLSLAFNFVRPFYKVKSSEKQIVDTINFMIEKGNLIGKCDIPQFSSNIRYQLIETTDDSGNKRLALSKLYINEKEVDIKHPNKTKIYKAAVDELYTDTNYFGESFNPKAGEPSQPCTDKNNNALDIVKGLADYLRNYCVDPETRELTFDVEPKNITVIEKSELPSSDKKLSFVA